MALVQPWLSTAVAPGDAAQERHEERAASPGGTTTAVPDSGQPPGRLCQNIERTTIATQDGLEIRLRGVYGAGRERRDGYPSVSDVCA
jgi:hypothetical protein